MIKLDIISEKLIPNKKLLNILELNNCNNTEIKFIELKGLSDFSNERIIDIFFKENIIKAPDGLTNKISILENNFYNLFNYQVVTFWYVCNELKNFNNNENSNDDLVFEVPLNWVLKFINSIKFSEDREYLFDKTDILKQLIVW